MHNLLAQVNLNTLFTVVGIVAAIAILFAVLIMVGTLTLTLDTSSRLSSRRVRLLKTTSIQAIRRMVEEISVLIQSFCLQLL